ncbi:MAG: TlpA family protein disulfide reductase [Desulfovermiculus sp.]
MRHLQTLCISLILVFFMAGPALAISKGSSAPAFEIVTLDGTEIDLQEYAEEGPVLLFFWSTWCDYCKDEMEAIQDLEEEYAPEGLQVLGINPGWRDNEQRARSFQDQYGADLPLAFDQSGDLGQKYKLQGVPTLFLLDREGTVLFSGHNISPELRDTLDQYLSES